jgi:hypothetical protein
VLGFLFARFERAAFWVEVPFGMVCKPQEYRAAAVFEITVRLTVRLKVNRRGAEAAQTSALRCLLTIGAEDVDINARSTEQLIWLNRT